jgi:hypothetical protein
MSQDLTPVGGDEEEELDETTLDEQEIPEGGAPEGGESDDEAEEMPDDLLTDEERAERTRERAGRAPVAPVRETEDRSAVVAELREIFQGLRQEQPAAQPREQDRRVPAELQPFVLSEEQAQRLTDKALTEPGGIAKLIAAAVNIGDKRAMARMANSSEGQSALQSSGRVFVNDYLEDRLDDPKEKYAKAIKPYFKEILAGYNVAELASMNQADRTAWFDEQWERATGRAYSRKAVTKAAPSPGVARGAGARPGAPGVGRVVIKMTDQQKKDLRAASPRLFSGEEGEKRFRRQVWEIEHSMTGNPTVRALTRESVRFGEAVGFGG